MQIIDAHDLVLVTGGTQAPPQQAGTAPQQGAPAGGGFLTGLQQFFGFLQSPAFQQIIGGFQQIISSLGQGAAPPGGAQLSAGAAPAGQAPRA